jgi:UDP-glucose 4-epimerase
MRVVVTGSSGHLGEALAHTLHEAGHEVVGIDRLPGRLTTRLGSIADRGWVKQCLAGAQTVFHTATLHRPHVDSHSRQDFVDTNITGTLALLEEAAAARVEAFVYTSTTSVFGDALIPPPGAPAAWITEAVAPIARNIYGATKAAAEDLCRLFARDHGLPTIVLRTSRFFPEADFDDAVRAAYPGDNMKVNEYLYRRVDIADAVEAHLLAAERAGELGFARYIVSATTPFSTGDLAELRSDAAAVVRRLFPEYEAEFIRRGWKMVSGIDRVYVNESARRELGWRPRYDFRFVVERLRAGEDWCSPLARLIGSKGYHRAQ